MRYPKPLRVHVKAIIASLVPLAFAVLFSWLFPLSVVTISRVDPERVDCQLEQRLLGVFPILRTEIHDLRGAYVFEDEANNRSSSGRTSESTYRISLVDAQGRETLSPANRATVHDIASRIRAFIVESPEPTLVEWTAPFLGYSAPSPSW